MRPTATIDRRTFVRAGWLVAGGAVLAGCTTGTDDGDGGSDDGDSDGDGSEGSAVDGGDGSPGDGEGSGTGGDGAQSFDGWLDDTDNFDGVVDETGSGEVTVRVGAQGNGGAYAFEPAAVRVDPGTSVVWEWTGEGSAHNVVANDGSFESELVDEPGHTFEHTFDGNGTYKYACGPHEAMGMKGVVVVE